MQAIYAGSGTITACMDFLVSCCCNRLPSVAACAPGLPIASSTALDYASYCCAHLHRTIFRRLRPPQHTPSQSCQRTILAGFQLLGILFLPVSRMLLRWLIILFIERRSKDLARLHPPARNLKTTNRRFCRVSGSSCAGPGRWHKSAHQSTGLILHLSLWDSLPSIWRLQAGA